MNKNLIQTIKGKDYSSVHPRVLKHNGCVIDLGCLTWDWSSFFIGKKRIVGVDPFENKIEGVELFKGLIGASDGKTFIKNKGFSSSIFFNDEKDNVEFSVLSWKNFCNLYGIDKISILKINIEGAEYPLLHSLDVKDYKNIDQITISFHDRKNADWIELTKASLYLLKNVNFEIIKISQRWNWYLAIKNNM